MLIREIILRENYDNTLITVIRDLLTMYQTAGAKEISTQEFNKKLSDEGFEIDVPGLIQAIDRSGFATSVNADKIVPKGELPAEMTAGEPETDVGDIAGKQAMKSIKREL
jgi:hypothetical protein